MKPSLRTRGIRLAAALAILCGTAGLASLTMLGTQAQADPVSTTGYVGVGSDVTQDFFDSLSGASAPDSTTTNFYTPLHTASTDDNRVVQSYDAFPEGGSTLNPGCITTTAAGNTFDRPNSSTAGIAALNAEIAGGNSWENTTGSCTGAEVNVSGQIQFARSARGPKTTGSTLTFIPYGRDALGILIFDHGDGVLNDLTTAQLNTIYSSSTGQTDIDGDEVEGCLTLTGSAPTSNLESAIGVSASTALQEAEADDPSGTTDCSQVQQNSGNAFWSQFASNLPKGTDAILPISAGDWIAQANGVAVDESATARSEGLTLASITDGSNDLGLPYSGTAPDLKPNTTYYEDTGGLYGYNLYTVVPTNKLSGTFADAGLESLFVGPSSALCSAAYQTQMNTFGFDDLQGTEGTCGTTTQTGNG
jgi:hypothetical protein